MTPMMAYRHALCEALGGLDNPAERDLVRRLIAKIDKREEKCDS